uniref:Uncharacterized protein n=1 Tax=Clastoptera arizonana TaxID=38151 RepID=A0A1B6CYG8_9HEMI
MACKFLRKIVQIFNNNTVTSKRKDKNSKTSTACSIHPNINNNQEILKFRRQQWIRIDEISKIPRVISLVPNHELFRIAAAIKRKTYEKLSETDDLVLQQNFLQLDSPKLQEENAKNDFILEGGNKNFPNETPDTLNSYGEINNLTSQLENSKIHFEDKTIDLEKQIETVKNCNSCYCSELCLTKEKLEDAINIKLEIEKTLKKNICASEKEIRDLKITVSNLEEINLKNKVSESNNLKQINRLETLCNELTQTKISLVSELKNMKHTLENNTRYFKEQSETYQIQISNLENDFSEHKTRSSKFNENFIETKKHLSDLKRENKYLKMTVINNKKEINDLNLEISQKTSDISKLTNIQTLNYDIKSLNDTIGKQKTEIMLVKQENYQAILRLEENLNINIVNDKKISNGVEVSMCDCKNIINENKTMATEQKKLQCMLSAYKKEVCELNKLLLKKSKEKEHQEIVLKSLIKENLKLITINTKQECKLTAYKNETKKLFTEQSKEVHQLSNDFKILKKETNELFEDKELKNFKIKPYEGFTNQIKTSIDHKILKIENNS